MGYFHYTSQQVFGFDDYLLTHLRTVIVSKLLQQESFLFTWQDGGIQRSIWLHPSLPLSFEFDSAEVPHINREWVTELLALANGPGGLRVIPEPQPRAPQAAEGSSPG